jgi:hypothetical protein
VLCPVEKCPLKSTHQTEFGSTAWLSGAEDGGVWRRRRRGTINPLRLEIAAKVLTAGSDD